MRIAVLRETADAERRVAATPETVKKLIALGATVAVEVGAGLGANIADAAFADAGASIGDRAATVAGSDLILAVQTPDIADLPGIASGTMLAGTVSPFTNRARTDGYAAAGVTAMAMELMPRITRAQSMDILSSQSNLSGYKAVIDAAEAYGRAFPMMMTAAGTISAARVFVMGVGVAGLQAIATARRLGAVVTATDVRAATKEQVESLGAKFIAVEDEEFKSAETTAGYAKPMSAEYQAKQAVLVSEHIKKQDIVITTALIPGRAAPRLVTAAQVASMKPGSVLIDLAVDQGGNVEGALPDQTVDADGVKIVGIGNLAGRIPADASALYARNLSAFLGLLLDKEGAVAPNPDEEILKAALVTHGGEIVHPALKAA